MVNSYFSGMTLSIDYLVSTGKELKEYLFFVISVKKFAETK